MIRALPSFERLGGVALLAVPAAVVFAMGFDDGAYALASRSFWAIAVWWSVVLAGALHGLHTRRIGWPALAIGALLAALALLQLVSAAWGSSAERTVNEFNRSSLYLGVFALGLLFASRISRARLCDGLALGICGVVGVALLSRVAPDLFSDRGFAEALPSAAKRLSFPVGYWNGLAILAALAVPLLLRTASAAGAAVVRGAAVAPLPAIAAAIYLASSRGGYVTAAIGAAAFLLLTSERWWPATALAVGCAASAVAVVALGRQDEFVNLPSSEVARDQSATAALSILLACLAAWVAYAALVRLLRGRRPPGRAAGVAVTAVVVLALVVGIAAADPVAQARAFKRPPGEALVSTGDFVRSHLLSANGSGRWQFWESAWDAFEAAPLIGQGAGSYEAWWAEHGTLAVFVRDAHSLYFELLAEVGIAGFLLLAAAFAIGVGTALRRLPRLSRADRRDLAAPTAVFLAFAAAAGFDWMWELTVVSGVGFVCLAAMVSFPAGPEGGARGISVRSAALVAGVTAAWVLLCLQAVPYVGELQIGASQRAAARGDQLDALTAAQSARAIEPWASSPWLQLALVREHLGQIDAARAAIARALENDGTDWRLWLVDARLSTKAGDVAAARASLRRARSLNPRSPLFHGG